MQWIKTKKDIDTIISTEEELLVLKLRKKEADALHGKDIILTLSNPVSRKILVKSFWDAPDFLKAVQEVKEMAVNFINLTYEKMPLNYKPRLSKEKAIVTVMKYLEDEINDQEILHLLE